MRLRGKLTISRRANFPRRFSIIPTVDKLLTSAVGVLFPKFCISCQTLGYSICPKCLIRIKAEAIDFPMCLVCENLCINGHTHKACYPNTPLTHFLASYAYTGITRKILKAKDRNSNLLKTLLQIQPAQFLPSIFIPDIIVPIPPSNKYLNPRITEPTQIIAEYIGIATKKPIYHLLYKPWTAKPQKTKSLKNRYNTTILIKRDALHIAKNKRILLVDDVCTTGSTLNAAAKRLKQFGAKDVLAYTLARDLRYNKA